MGDVRETAPAQSERLQLMLRLSLPALSQAVRALRVTEGSRGLDAGCGAGGHLRLLADEVGPTGRLTGLDLSAESLAAARTSVEDLGVGRGCAPRVDLVEGDIRRLPFEDDAFDWIWCADTLWPGAVVKDPLPVLEEFARVVRPGGTIALAYWSSQTLLPGYPALEARLNAAFAETALYLAGVPAGLHILKAGEWLRRAGLKRPRAKSFLAEVKGPLDRAKREAVAACLTMFWGDLGEGLSPSDQAAYHRLCDPESPDFIADDPDYYALITYSMFWGRV